MKNLIAFLMLMGCSDFDVPTSTFHPDPPVVYEVIRTYDVSNLTTCVVMAAPSGTVIRLCGDEGYGQRKLDVPVGTECLEIISSDKTIKSDPYVLTDKACK